MRISIAALLSFTIIGILSCKVSDNRQNMGSIDRMDKALDGIIDADARVEVLSQGYEWSEGPLWIESEKMLLFSDVPMNTVYKWTEADSIEVYLKPSGYTSSSASNSAEEGSNGLALTADGKLVLCQHGDRRLAVMDAPVDAPASSFTSIADNFEGKKFNSPNDVAIHSNGDFFFTVPPYGMPKNATQEIPF